MIGIVRVLALGSLALADMLQPPLELVDWAENRYKSYIFCINYDDSNRVHLYGCSVEKLPSCYGNVCYLRQHKNPFYYLYTSGCLNITRKQIHRFSTLLRTQKPDSSPKGNESQLCEVIQKTNACICTNKANCNNVTTTEPFTEYKINFLEHIYFDELAHMRYLAPNDPVLMEITMFRKSQMKDIFNAPVVVKYVMTHGLITIVLNFCFLQC